MKALPIHYKVRAVFAALVTLLFFHSTYGSTLPIVNFDPSTQVSDPRVPGQYWGLIEGHANGMVGWTFDLLKAVIVEEVGWYDDGQDGLSRDFQVGLWGPGGQLLGSRSFGSDIQQGLARCGEPHYAEEKMA